MAKSLLTCQTLGGVPMGRSRDHPETRSMKDGHPIFAALYDPIGASAERRWMGERRRRLLAGARGAVFEIGGGTGANLAHYWDVDRVTIAEPNPFMRNRIGPKLEDARVPSRSRRPGQRRCLSLTRASILWSRRSSFVRSRIRKLHWTRSGASCVRAEGCCLSSTYAPLSPRPAGRTAWSLSGDGSSAAATPIVILSLPSRRPGSR